MKLTSEAEKVLFRQSYEKTSVVDGVRVVEIKRFTGEDGAFSEIVRIEDGLLVQPQDLVDLRFEVRQVNHGLVVPGTLKAWHLHGEQDEIWFVHPEARVIVGLLDVREGSKTERTAMRLSLGSGKAHLVYIPRGVAHGLANPYPEQATMTYLVNNWFNGEDELRLPVNFGVEPDFWEIRKG